MTSSEIRAVLVGDVAIWKLAGFNFEPQYADRIFDSVTKKAASLVIDLRGNGGGMVKTLEQIAGRLFDKDVKLADLNGRRSMKAVTATRRRPPRSSRACCSSKAVGVVVGDRFAGSVMQGLRMGGILEGVEGFIPFEFSVTNAGRLMKDGKGLEHTGLVPDRLLRPAAADLAAGRDPVLARAVALGGGLLDPALAGRLLPVQ